MVSIYTICLTGRCKSDDDPFAVSCHALFKFGCHSKAVCGLSPDGPTIGWLDYEVKSILKVTCPKCKEILRKQMEKEKQHA